jgi:hypothetical protein
MAFSKADESLVCSEKNLTVSSNLHYYAQKIAQFLSLLLMNTCIVFLQFLNKGPTVIFFYFHRYYLYHQIFYLFGF